MEYTLNNLTFTLSRVDNDITIQLLNNEVNKQYTSIINSDTVTLYKLDIDNFYMVMQTVFASWSKNNTTNTELDIVSSNIDVILKIKYKLLLFFMFDIVLSQDFYFDEKTVETKQLKQENKKLVETVSVLSTTVEKLSHQVSTLCDQMTSVLTEKQKMKAHIDTLPCNEIIGNMLVKITGAPQCVTH